MVSVGRIALTLEVLPKRQRKPVPRMGQDGAVGTTHSHRALKDADLEIDALPRVVLLTTLGLIGVATIIATVLLWPKAEATDDLRGSIGFAAPGVTFPQAKVVS